MANLLNVKQKISYIQRNVSAYGRVIDYIAHCSFPYSVKVDTNQVSVRIDHRTTGISAGSVVGGKEANRLVFVPAFSIYIPEFLRNIVVKDIRIVLLYYTLQAFTINDSLT